MGSWLFSYQNLSANLNNKTMTAFDEKHSDILEENLRDTLPEGGASAGTTSSPASEPSNPYTRAEDPAHAASVQSQANELNGDESFGENAGLNFNSQVSDYELSAGPGDDDEDDDDDDDDFLDDDDDDTLIPIEGDEEDDDALLSADEDEDVIPGTDLDDDNLDDDDDDQDSTINRSTLGDIGTNNTSRDAGRNTGRMIDHEPGTTEV
jgi:hypothetical protein